MTDLIFATGFCLLGYLCGSLSFAVWVTRMVKGVDVREAGSGHATTTNTIRQAGFLAGALVFVLDVSKGFIPTWLALRFAPSGWIAPLTAAMVVVGHCWPLFAGFRGGMGLAPANGGMMAAAPLSIFVIYTMLGLLTLILRHSARASVITGILFAPLLWLVGFRGPGVVDRGGGGGSGGAALPDRLEPQVPGIVAGSGESPKALNGSAYHLQVEEPGR